MVVKVGVEGDLVQKARQGGLALRVLDVALDGGGELPHVFKAGAVLHVVLGGEHGLVAAAGHHLVIKGGQVHGPGQGGKGLEHGGELPELGRRLLKLRVGGGVRDDLPQGQPLLRGDGAGALHGGAANAPGRIVDDAAQAQVVLMVGDDAQIGQHVLDLRAVKEAGAADDPVGDAVALEGHLKLV